MVLSVCLFRLWQDYRDATRIERVTGMLCAVWGALQIAVIAATMTGKIPEGVAEGWVRLLLVGSAVEEFLIAVSCLLLANLTRKQSKQSMRALFTFFTFISGEFLFFWSDRGGLMSSLPAGGMLGM